MLTLVRESSFNMTRGETKILRGGSENFWTPERGALKNWGGSKNLYTLNPKGGGLLKN